MTGMKFAPSRRECVGWVGAPPHPSPKTPLDKFYPEAVVVVVFCENLHP